METAFQRFTADEAFLRAEFGTAAVQVGLPEGYASDPAVVEIQREAANARRDQDRRDRERRIYTGPRVVTPTG